MSEGGDPASGDQTADGAARGPAPTRGRALPAVATLSLFAVLAAASLAAEFGEPAGFPEGSVVRNIGYALLNLEIGTIPAEGLLAAFLIIAVGLDIAVDAAIYLAKREEGGAVVSAVGEAFTDGGRPVGEDGSRRSAGNAGSAGSAGSGADPEGNGGTDR